MKTSEATNNVQTGSLFGVLHRAYRQHRPDRELDRSRHVVRHHAGIAAKINIKAPLGNGRSGATAAFSWGLRRQ